MFDDKWAELLSKMHFDDNCFVHGLLTVCSVLAGILSTELQPPARQTSPGPFSLELFGLEETEDAPLDLPVQATLTRLPTVASSIDMTTSDAKYALGQAPGMLQFGLRAELPLAAAWMFTGTTLQRFPCL